MRFQFYYTSFLLIVHAFWRLPCYSRLGVYRIDPIVFPGRPSSHAHTLHGAQGVSFTSSYEDLLSSHCTTCAVQQDRSVYWTPLLMFSHENGTVEAVPQISGMLVYYFLFGKDITAFPQGFRMVAGDATRQNSTLPTPVPQLSFWGPNDTTQQALAQKAIGFNCLNYNIDAEGALQRHFLPNRSFIDANCRDGIRAELMFPSCWDGASLDSSNHTSHMAYPDQLMEGTCPAGYETRVPALYFETVWNTSAFRGMSGTFALSNGDYTGFSYHGDFLNGWEIEVLEQAITLCTNSSGLVEDCPVFSLQSALNASQCQFTAPSLLKDENCLGPRKNFCGQPLGARYRGL